MANGQHYGPRVRPYGMGEVLDLSSGGTVEVPDDFFSWIPAQQRQWIEQSNLSPEVASQLEADYVVEAPAGGAGVGPSGAVPTAAQLKKAIDNSSAGYISVAAGSPAYVVARNNSWQFSLTQDPSNPSQYAISAVNWMLWGGIAVGAVALMALLSAGK